MNRLQSVEVIACVCVLVLFILILKRRAQFVLNFLVRVVVGAIGILMLNDFFEKQQLTISVGLNPASLLTVGTLGVAGIALLYGMVASKFL